MLLAIIGALNSVISLFYYFQIGKAMFMEDASVEVSIRINHTTARSIVALAILVILLLEFYRRG